MLNPPEEDEAPKTHEGAKDRKTDSLEFIPTYVRLKCLLVGRPIDSARSKHERITNAVGLAVFSSDPLSSVAYATEEILLVLVLGGSLALSYSMPIAIAIVLLLAIVATSYRQTIHAYPSGGGAYTVAKDNLGLYPGLVAASALLIDYVLTVAVSVSAGVAALTSAFPPLYGHTVMICLLVTFLIMLVNLRGVRESGMIFSFPTYFFIFSLIAMIITGVIKVFFFGVGISAAGSQLVVLHPLTIFLILRAFSSGCTAMTGVEAISNGIQAFRPPESKNAAKTLTWMAFILAVLFIGITFLAFRTGVVPIEGETVVSQIGRSVFGGSSPLYFTVQIATMLILVLAANTSFADFPRLSSLLARDRFLPRQLSNLGDRLVFSNGIVLLSVFSALLLVVFEGKVHSFIPLYAVGVFLSFTLSQAGMVSHWFKLGRLGQVKNWFHHSAINGIGALATATVLLITASVKFTHGAWIVVLLIPIFVIVFRTIHGHYELVGKQLALEHLPRHILPTHAVVVPVSGFHRAVVEAIEYARSISMDVTAVYVDIDGEATRKLKERWKEGGVGVPLVVLPSPYRSIVQPLLAYIASVKEDHPEGYVTVVVPEFVVASWWEQLLHNQTALLLKTALLFKKGIIVTSVPFHLRR